jgi:hypothetical protein
MPSNQPQIKVEVGQIWIDNDKRNPQREVEVSWIALSRFRPTSTRYRLKVTS